MLVATGEAGEEDCCWTEATVSAIFLLLWRGGGVLALLSFGKALIGRHMSSLIGCQMGRVVWQGHCLRLCEKGGGHCSRLQGLSGGCGVAC